MTYLTLLTSKSRSTMVTNSEIVTYNSVFKVGVVFSVDGRDVKVKVDRNKNTSHLFYKGNLVKNVSVGSYVKIIKGFISIIGKVESEHITNKENDKIYYSTEDEIFRLLNVKLIGFFDNGTFNRGINELPLIDNECFLLTAEEYKSIHSFGSNEEAKIKIGHIASDTQVEVSLSINKLFSSHIGIFGNTGSGKSYTLSKIYRQLFLQYEGKDNFKENAHFVFFDFNGEYSTPDSIISEKIVYNLTTRKDDGQKIPLSVADMLDLNILSIFSSATEKTQRPFLERCIRLYDSIGNDLDKTRNFLKSQIKKVLSMSDKGKGDLMIDYLQQILPKNIDEETGADLGLRIDFLFHNTSGYYYLIAPGVKEHERSFVDHPAFIEDTLLFKKVEEFKFSDNFLTNFIVIMYMQLIYDILANRAINEHIAPAIHKLKSAEKSIEKVFSFNNDQDLWGDSNIVVINLNGVNVEMKKMIPLLVVSKLYKKHKELDDDKKYLNFIVDEAHNILSYQSNRESEDWKDYRLEVFEEIIKEGRKFGVFMTIASQRPSDISSTIISQLHNYFIHRLVNEKDIEQVNNTISYLDKVSVESLPILMTGVCVIAGQLVEMPVVVQIDRIEEKYKPDNATIRVADVWS